MDDYAVIKREEKLFANNDLFAAGKSIGGVAGGRYPFELVPCNSLSIFNICTHSSRLHCYRKWCAFLSPSYLHPGERLRS